MLQKRWTINDAPPEACNALAAQLNGNHCLARLLVGRQINSFEDAKRFFNPNLDQLHDPFLMRDMHLAVLRTSQALERGEKIMVFGDYDVDGTSAVATLYQFLLPLAQTRQRLVHGGKNQPQALHKAVAANHPSSRLQAGGHIAIAPFAEQISYYIPHRFKEGYGVSRAGIEKAAEDGVGLIISVDCGIKSTELVGYAASLGIDFIICDHHLPDPQLPAAVAILNPKQHNCDYPCKDLCGCGIVFKFIQALSQQYNLPAEAYLQFLDLSAVAIAADIVPLTGENRTLAHFGLEALNRQPRPGLAALLKLAAAPISINLTNLVFLVAPRINAAGRMDDGKLAVQLLVEQNEVKAMELAELLHRNNVQRKEADKNTSAEALAMIDGSEEMQARNSTVVYNQHWHKGVVGIVASRLVDKYYRPTVVLARSGQLVAGSARSVPGFNLYEAIHACREHLIGYGGHFAAAGLTIEEEKIPDFAYAFEEYVAAHWQPEDQTPQILIDAELPLPQIDLRLYKQLCRMEPFGPQNMKPVFLASGVRHVGESRVVGQQREGNPAGAHLKVMFEQQGVRMAGIGFGLGHRINELNHVQRYDVVYQLELNEYKGSSSLQMKLIDFREHQRH